MEAAKSTEHAEKQAAPESQSPELAASTDTVSVTPEEFLSVDAEIAQKQEEKEEGNPLFLLTGKKLFRRRMTKEKKWDQIQARIKEVRRAQKVTFPAAYHIVIREFGYINAQEEKLRLKVELEGKAERKKNCYAATDIKSFESAVATLPDNASPRAELDWIRAHPAMVRKTRSKNTAEHITIHVKDILHAPHGKAPSKSAVYALQHWANNTSEFFKTLLSEHKKKADDGGGAKQSAETEEDLSEVERLLQEVSRG